MAAEKVEATNVNVSGLIQRQLMLLDFQEQEKEWGLRTWPTAPGISMDESRRLFEIMERWGWIAGSPLPPDNFKCVITSQGVERLTKIKAGQPLMDAKDLKFVDDDHRILGKVAIEPSLLDGEDSSRTLPDKIGAWIYQLSNSRPFLCLISFLGIVLITMGTHLNILEGLTFQSWGTLLITVGALFAVGSLRWGFRNVERRHTALRWFLVVIALLLFILIAWLPFHGTIGHGFAAYLSVGVVLAVIPLPGPIRRPLLGSNS